MSQARKYDSPSARQSAYRVRREEARLAQLEERGLPPLPVLPTLPGSARWTAVLHQAVGSLRLVCSEMTDYFEARSEVWQLSERGEAHQERLGALEEILESLSEWEG